MRLDPILARAVAAMPTRPDTSAATPERYAQVRETAHAYFGLHRLPPAIDVAETDHVVPGSGQVARIYRPADELGPLPALLWIHGGGFTLGAIDADDQRCRGYARAARCAVVSAEYRLAPEHPYPAGLDDCWAALRWVVEEADALDVDPGRVAVGGASAGGCLAAALTHRSRDRAELPVVFQLLVYPMLDDRLQTPSMRDMGDVPVFRRRDAEASWRRYLGATGATVSPDAAPGRAEDLGRLPPAYVLAAEHDPLRDEALDYAVRLQAAGVPTELHLVAGAFHGFEAIGIDAPIVRRSLDEQARAVRDALHDPLVAV